MCMVDLPGYGFAYAKEEVKEAWEDLVSTRLALSFLGFYMYYLLHLLVRSECLGFLVLVLNIRPL